MSLIILAKSGEGRQRERVRESWADAVKWAAEAKWIFGSGEKEGDSIGGAES